MDNSTYTVRKHLTLSQRIARILASIILVVVVTTEALLPLSWSLTLSAIAVYTISTGLSGWDPILKLLKQSQLLQPDQKLGIAAQFECAAIGAVCVTVGFLYSSSDSVVLRLLPFFGIYPILICAIKYDLLSYLLHSYLDGNNPKHTDQK
ncbi:MAG: hypothetical protein AMJ53_02080 [Gammaproteobacteria bacterium SG8_11]|nr:MAG: hypothetical protein AMJ53_02080 [Gammaproteobacteria bacterium SG8_11]